jgi:hypothetical protein
LTLTSRPSLPETTPSSSTWILILIRNGRITISTRPTSCLNAPSSKCSSLKS